MRVTQNKTTFTGPNVEDLMQESWTTSTDLFAPLFCLIVDLNAITVYRNVRAGMLICRQRSAGSSMTCIVWQLKSNIPRCHYNMIMQLLYFIR